MSVGSPPEIVVAPSRGRDRKWRHRGLPGAERHAARLRRVVRQHGLASRGRPLHAGVRAVPGVLGGGGQLRQERQLVVAGARTVRRQPRVAELPDALRQHGLLDVVLQLALICLATAFFTVLLAAIGGVRVLPPAVPGPPGGPADAAADPDVPGVRGLRGHLPDHPEIGEVFPGIGSGTPGRSAARLPRRSDGRSTPG